MTPTPLTLPVNRTGRTAVPPIPRLALSGLPDPVLGSLHVLHRPVACELASESCAGLLREARLRLSTPLLRRTSVLQNWGDVKGRTGIHDKK